MEELRALLLAKAQEHGLEMDEGALSSLAASFETVTKDALKRAVAHLKPPARLGSRLLGGA